MSLAQRISFRRIGFRRIGFRFRLWAILPELGLLQVPADSGSRAGRFDRQDENFRK